MKILIDDEAFIIQRYGGVSRIFAEIIKRLKQNKLLFYNFYSENEYLINLKLNGIKPFLKNFQFPLKGKIIRFISRFISRPFVIRNILSNKVDLFHSSFYSDYYLKALKNNNKVKFVFTVHDLIHELMPEVKGNKKLAEIKRKNLLQSDYIIVVSESTKKDLIRIYPFINLDKISVIHLANSLEIVSEKVFNLPKKYLLFVGERRGYKNFLFFISAFHKFSQTNKEYNVVCTGSMSFSKSELAFFNSLNLQDKVFHFKCNDKQLRFVYENATMFIFPSLYEGFGIPILEAFASKVPTILSNSSSLPEVAQNAALYFNPQNESELVKNMNLIVNDKKLCDDLVNKGLERLKDFSWDKHFQSTLSIYEKLNNS